MRDNYIIGILAGIAIAQLPIWEYNHILQPIMIIGCAGFWVAWGKRTLEDMWKERGKGCEKKIVF